MYVVAFPDLTAVVESGCSESIVAIFHSHYDVADGGVLGVVAFLEDQSEKPVTKVLALMADLYKGSYQQWDN